MPTDWMCTSTSQYIDIHGELHDYEKVLSFFETIEDEFDVLKYCSGANAAGRWIFQVYSREFIRELADIVNEALRTLGNSKPVLEVMGGDGRLSEFLKTQVSSEIICTDSRQGEYDIAYPKWVLKMNALESVEEFGPSVVIMSWEPFFSTVGGEIVDSCVPTVWIGDRNHCAVHSEMFDKPHIKMNSEFALGRKDSFGSREFNTDIYLFNWPSAIDG
ncbi:MAG: hypothetical protein JSW05_01390 [Candidatus Thorarchaeota archaeon]|nr:MAG: hypothetical protein JSW05_01390 [Candidatus Thorarchaeota archaeon]